MFKPNQRQASDLVDLVNPDNLRSLLEGQISVPDVNGKYTFAIRSSQHEGSFATPDYGKQSSNFYSKSHYHHYQLDLPNIVSFVGNGTSQLKNQIW